MAVTLRDLMRSSLFGFSGLVGVRGFEPPASTSRTWRASQAALHPDGARKEPIGNGWLPLITYSGFGSRSPDPRLV